MTAPYDALAMIAAVANLMATEQGQILLSRLLGESGITQSQLEAAVKEAGPPGDPTVPRP